MAMIWCVYGEFTRCELCHVLVSPFKVTAKHYVEISVFDSKYARATRLCGKQYEILAQLLK